MELPNLRPADRARVKIGNRTMRASARLTKVACLRGVPCFLENPASSLLWAAPPIARSFSRGGGRRHVLDFCQFGKPRRKRTAIASWGAPPWTDICRQCSGRGGACSRTGAPHVQLTGVDKSSGQLWTRIAEPYPASLCSKAADHLVSSFVMSRSVWARSIAFGRQE